MCKLFYLYCKVESSSCIVITMIIIGVIMAVALKMYYYLQLIKEIGSDCTILLRMRRSPRIEGWANLKTARAGEELVGVVNFCACADLPVQ